MKREKRAPWEGHDGSLRGVIRRKRLCILQNNYYICCVGYEYLCIEQIEHEKNEGNLIFQAKYQSNMYKKEDDTEHQLTN